MASGNVTDLISVVNITGRGRENSFEGFDHRVCRGSLVVVTREVTLKIIYDNERR